MDSAITLSHWFFFRITEMAWNIQFKAVRRLFHTPESNVLFFLTDHKKRLSFSISVNEKKTALLLQYNRDG